MSDDVFCKIAQGDIDADIVYEDDDVVAFQDMNPAAPTHILIIPRKHIVNLYDADEADAELLGKLMLAARDIAREQGLEEDGFRLVVNNEAGVGQSVFHLHMHILGGRAFSWPPG